MRLDAKPVTELSDPLAQPPAAFSAACADPMVLPDRALNRGEVLRDWAQDRAGLISCKERHAAVIDFYRLRDTLLAGQR